MTEHKGGILRSWLNEFEVSPGAPGQVFIASGGVRFGDGQVWDCREVQELEIPKDGMWYTVMLHSQKMKNHYRVLLLALYSRMLFAPDRELLAYVRVKDGRMEVESASRFCSYADYLGEGPGPCICQWGYNSDPTESQSPDTIPDTIRERFEAIEQCLWGGAK